MAKKRGGLGRGLESLFEDTAPSFESDNRIETLPLREIEPDPAQPRKTFDEETLTTINKFFENNLNVSETSRQLYVHRNTLVYRLEKLQKSTGLDIRVFDDALTFKIAMMVVSYMKLSLIHI